MSLVQTSRDFAVAWHKDQKYGDKPYSFHLDMVAQIVCDHIEDSHYQVVAYLHDILEDTACPSDLIMELFGLDVSRSLILLTDPLLPTRKERKRESYRKLAACTDDAALVVKAADRLANLRCSFDEGNESLLKMYKQEHYQFAKAVYRIGLNDELIEQCDSILGFFP